MTNTFNANVRALQQMTPEFSDLLDVFTGKIEPDGSLNPNPQSGLAGNYIWVHDARGNRRVQNALEIAAKVAGRSVTIGLSRRTQEYEVLRLNAAIPDEVQGVVSIGDVILAKAESFSAGFVIPQTGLAVYISPFHYHGGTWKGGTLTVTPTATSGMKAALLIGVNTLTGLAVQALGTDAADNELFILSPFDDDIVRVKAENPQVAWRSVVVVSNGATDFTGATFYSIGEWGITEPKHNYSASAPPTVNDDETAGYSVGSEWFDGVDIFDLVDGSVGAADWNLRASGSADDYILIREEQAQNTDGGTFTSGAQRTRVLNTEVVDTGGHASLASNQVTLLAGTYRIEASAPALAVLQHQARWYNITDAAVEVLGTSEYAQAGTANVQTRSWVIGRFTIAGTKVFELQHQCNTTGTTNGFGSASNFTTEIYSVLKIIRE